MKNLVYILLLFEILSCNNAKKKSDNRTNQETPNTEKSKKILFVEAKNGLNFRDKPNGTIIGKFSYNYKLEIEKYTGIKQEINDNNKIVKGEWIGVIYIKDTVYVFDAYLTNQKDVSKLIYENKYHIAVNKLYKGKAKKIKNDTIIVSEIDLKDFFTINEIKENEFDDVYTQNLKSTELENDFKLDSVLTINCFKGKQLKFRDKISKYDDQNERYFYGKTFKDINSHLIIKSGWEWGSYYLVNYEKCVKTKLNGFPVFNSSYTKLICFDSYSQESKITLNSFNRQNIKVEYIFDLPISPYRCIFDDDSLFIESVVEWNDGKQYNKISSQYFKLRFNQKFNF